MSRRFLHCLHGGEQNDGKSDDFQKFHEMIDLRFFLSIHHNNRKTAIGNPTQNKIA